MKKFMKDAKATLGLVSSKTVDEDYEKRSKSLRQLHEVLSLYNSSMEKAKHAMKEVMSSLDEVAKTFEHMSNDGDLPKSLRDFAEEFKQSISNLEKGSFEKYVKAMDTTVMTAVGGLRYDYDECVKLEQQRSKVVNEYDVYREAVDKKEAEYSKKGKDLKDSKGYDDDVRKRDDLKEKYEEVSKEFKEKHDTVEFKRAQVNAKSAKEFTECTAAFLSDLLQEMTKLNEVISNIAV